MKRTYRGMMIRANGDPPPWRLRFVLHGLLAWLLALACLPTPVQ